MIEKEGTLLEGLESAPVSCYLLPDGEHEEMMKYVKVKIDNLFQ